MDIIQDFEQDEVILIQNGMSKKRFGEEIKMKKIVLIGPVYPFKTGLSYYVSLLYRQLKQNNEVKMLSYTMQYPKLLYKKPQKDYEDDVLKIVEAEYRLHTANPVNWLCTASYINKYKPDVVIFQWLHPYFAPCYWTLEKLIRKETKVLFICHNVFPHERFPMDRWLTKVALKPADYYITHSKSDAEDLKSIIKNPDVRVTVHPAYNFFKQKNMVKEEARKILGINKEEKVILFFGLVREYKGLKHLLNAMKLLKEMQVKLLIAGDFAGARAAYDAIISNNNIKEVVKIYDEHIPIGEVEKFFAACDLVVLPYESATQSGVIQVAYSFNKPVLATRVGGLPDVVINGETGYLVEPQNPEQIADAIIDFYTKNRAEAFMDGIEREKYRYSWEQMENVINCLTENIKNGL